jgi:uncharacterized membrane protein YdbT with pleckstrin-like domain
MGNNYTVEATMGYIQNNLNRDELVAYQTSLSKIIFLPAVCLAMVVIATYVLTSELDAGNAITKAVWVVCFLKTISTIVTYLTSEFGVTNRRVLGKTGFLVTNSLEIMLGKVEAIRIHQSFIGLILGYGDIIVIGTGGTNETLKNIPAPNYFRKVLQKQIDRYGLDEDMSLNYKAKSSFVPKLKAVR